MYILLWWVCFFIIFMWDRLHALVTLSFVTGFLFLVLFSFNSSTFSNLTSSSALVDEYFTVTTPFPPLWTITAGYQIAPLLIGLTLHCSPSHCPRVVTRCGETAVADDFLDKLSRPLHPYRFALKELLLQVVYTYHAPCFAVEEFSELWSSRLGWSFLCLFLEAHSYWLKRSS